MFSFVPYDYATFYSRRAPATSFDREDRATHSLDFGAARVRERWNLGERRREKEEGEGREREREREHRTEGVGPTL